MSQPDNCSTCRWKDAIVLLGIVALVLPSPWRLPAATNDEMLHLKSWRNRYGTDDVFPIGRRKIEKATNIPPRIKEIALRIYDSGPIGQRLFIVLQDCHPSVWPITAEIFATVSDSSLTAIRGLSTFAFLLALYFLYRIGRSMADHETGLALAAIWSVSHLALAYAGFARMYACAMAALAGFVYAFIITDVKNDKQFWRLCLLAIVPISLEWFTWPAVYTLLALAVYQRWEGAMSPTSVIKRYRALIPFIVVCILFMGYYVVLAKLHPSHSAEWSEGRGSHPAYEHFVDFFASIGFASFLKALDVNPVVLAVLHLMVYAAGIVFFVTRRTVSLELRCAIVLLFVAGLFLPTQIRMLSRHYMLTLFVPLTMSVFALVSLLPVKLRSIVAVLLLAFGITVAYTQERFLGKDEPAYDFPAMAQAVKQGIEHTEGRWVAFPYQLAMCVYRYESLPEPEMPSSRKELQEVLEQLPCGKPAVVLGHRWTAAGLESPFRELLRDGITLQEFPNGVVVLRIVKDCNGAENGHDTHDSSAGVSSPAPTLSPSAGGGGRLR